MSDSEQAPAVDPFLAALEPAEEDDEPSTDEERAAARAGWVEYLRGETVPWKVVRRELLERESAPSAATS
jgi:hypothetical protein